MTTANENLPAVTSPDLAVTREPLLVLDEARRAAKALTAVIDAKPKKVTFNGETYLEFEDWQTVGRFFGVTVEVESTRYVEYGEAHGFEARAIARRGDGTSVSAAEAMCLNDEANWRSKPQFMLRSMAQTRACAKALRNVLAWVVVLAGYKPTPVEEMDDLIRHEREQRKTLRGSTTTAAQASPAAASSPVAPPGVPPHAEQGELIPEPPPDEGESVPFDGEEAMSGGQDAPGDAVDEGPRVAPLCPVHSREMRWKEGASKDGKSYQFWACSQKDAGNYCKVTFNPPTENQFKRLYAIMREHKVSKEAVRNYCRSAFGVSSGKDLLCSRDGRGTYDVLCQAIEAGQLSA